MSNLNTFFPESHACTAVTTSGYYIVTMLKTVTAGSNKMFRAECCRDVWSSSFRAFQALTAIRRQQLLQSQRNNCWAYFQVNTRTAHQRDPPPKSSARS